MPRGKSASHALQQETILDTCAEVFAEHGYAAASMQSIAARCGVSKSLLYHYYPSKDAILYDMLTRYTRRLISIIAEVNAQHVPARETLDTLIRRFVLEYAHSRAMHAVLLRDARLLPPEQAQTVLDAQREIVKGFAVQIAACENLGLSEAKALAMAVFGMMNWTFTWLRPQGTLSYAQFAETIVSFVSGGLHPAAKTMTFASSTPNLKEPHQ